MLDVLRMSINLSNISYKMLASYGAISGAVSGGSYILQDIANKKIIDLQASIESGSPLEQNIEASIQKLQDNGEFFLILAGLAGAFALANFTTIGVKYFKNRQSKNNLPNY